MLLIINAEDCENEEIIMDILKGHTKYYKVKSRNISSLGMDMIIELTVEDGASLIKEIGHVSQVRKASLLTHDGEVTY